MAHIHRSGSNTVRFAGLHGAARISLGAAAAIALLSLTAPSAMASHPVACSVQGGGLIDGEDRFSGSGSNETGRHSGHWTHHTTSGERLVGSLVELVCLTDGGGDAGSPDEEPNRALVSGEGTWNGTTSVTFGLTTADRGEPNTRDEYGLVVIDSSTGELVYSDFGLVEDGNIQILTRTAHGH